MNFDFNYHKLEDAKQFDGFIGKNGRFYVVKTKGYDKNFHNLWAECYVKKFCQDYDEFFQLIGINDYIDLLVNIYGFVYYSHDSVYLRPIIQLPNHHLASKKPTSNQIESLIEIMLMNNEEPLNKEFLVDAEMFNYNELESRGCIKK